MGRLLASSRRGALPLLLVLAFSGRASCAEPEALAEHRELSLTLQEAFECQSHPGVIAFELHGGVLLEILLMGYILLTLYVLIEEHYVPLLEHISEVLNIPASLVGCTIMSAGNCIGDLSISLVAMMVSGAEVGTGEVLGACVFDLLCVLGLVCILLPKEGLELPKPLMVYFMLWVVVATSLDAMLFYTSVELTWCDAAHPGPRPCPSNPCTRRPPSTLASPPCRDDGPARQRRAHTAATPRPAGTWPT